ncbi:hypothetical protein YC2023_010150 [Brassica napus]
MLQEVFSMVQGRIIEHGSHKAARSDAVRRAFSYDGRIVGCRIVYPIDSKSSFTFWLDMRCMFEESLDFMCVLNGCLDLMQVENVEKLISAKSFSPTDAALEGIHTSLCPPFKG